MGVSIAARPVVVTSISPRPRLPQTVAPAGHIPPAIVGVVIRALTVEIDVDVLAAAWQIQYATLTANLAPEAGMPPTVAPVLERALTVEVELDPVLRAWQIQYAALTAQVPVAAGLPVLGDELSRELVAEVVVEASIPAVVVHTQSLVVEIDVDVDAVGTVVLSREVVAEVGMVATASPTQVHTRALVAEVAAAALAPAAMVLDRSLVAEIPVAALTPPTPVHTRALVAEVTPAATAPATVVTFVAMGVDKNGTQDPGRNTWTRVTGWTVRSGYPGTVESGGALIAEGTGATTIVARVTFNTGVIFVERRARLMVNGTQVAINTQSGLSTVKDLGLTFATTLYDGDQVWVEAYHAATTANERNVLAGASNTFLYWD
ncbi:hypothetical protein I0Q12_10005 [Rhodococcus sp. CX]|nr:hypothetical protein [Rhodococcus sp. CX]